jgi:hypothetical protein
MITELFFSLMILTFSSSTIIDSSSTTTTESNCIPDKIGRCSLVRGDYDFIRLHGDRAVPFSETVQIVNSSKGAVTQQSNDSVESMSVTHTICEKPYDVLFERCFNGFES